MLLVSNYSFAQDAANTNGFFIAGYNASTGMINYQKSGEISKDGIAVINLKISALDDLVKKNQSSEVLVAVNNEKQGLENLRKRILIQRERLIKPAPQLEEMH